MFNLVMRYTRYALVIYKLDIRKLENKGRQFQL